MSRHFAVLRFIPLLICGSLIVSCTVTAPEPVSLDGLKLVSTKPLDAVYKKPEVDMGVYQRFMIADCTVAFRKGWQREHNAATRTTGRVSDKDVLRIKTTLASMCTEAFSKAITESGRFSLAEEAAGDVLMVRPAIVDLDINAPDVMAAGRSTSYTTSEGSMRLNLEAFDSVTGEIVGRVIDKQRARDTGHIQWTNSVTNRAEANRILKRWATVLVDMLEQVKAH